MRTVETSSWTEHAAAAPPGMSWRDLYDLWDGNPRALMQACRRRNAERLAQLEALRVDDGEAGCG